MTLPYVEIDGTSLSKRQEAKSPKCKKGPYSKPPKKLSLYMKKVYNP